MNIEPKKQRRDGDPVLWFMQPCSHARMRKETDTDRMQRLQLQPCCNVRRKAGSPGHDLGPIRAALWVKQKPKTYNSPVARSMHAQKDWRTHSHQSIPSLCIIVILIHRIVILIRLILIHRIVIVFCASLIICTQTSKHSGILTHALLQGNQVATKVIAGHRLPSSESSSVGLGILPLPLPLPLPLSAGAAVFAADPAHRNQSTSKGLGSSTYPCVYSS